MDNFPPEVISKIFQFLPRPDRLNCTAVCWKWRQALDRKFLWQHFSIKIDKDFLDPTTTVLISKYHKYIDSIEFGWEKPMLQNRWLPLKTKELTKRVVRNMFVLHDNNVQIQSFRMFEWYEAYPFKKIIYHFTRFLKIQRNLKKLIFNNVNLPRPACMKILDACLGSKETILSLEIHNYYYTFNTTFDVNEFIERLHQFSCLQELKLDYFIFSEPNVIDIIAGNGKNVLKFLEIFFDEVDQHSAIIPTRKWRKLTKSCPGLKISFCIRNICHHDQINFLFLMEQIPLTSFSLMTGEKFDQNSTRNFEATLSQLIGVFHNTLEYIHLDLKNNKENLDNLLFDIILKCRKLKKLYFDGMINQDMELFHQIYKHQESLKGLHVTIIPIKYKLPNAIHLFS